MSNPATGSQEDFRLEYESAKTELDAIIEFWKQVQGGQASVSDFAKFMASNY